MQNKRRNKTIFFSEKIRDLTVGEKILHKKLEEVIYGTILEFEIAMLHDFVSHDGKARPLIFSFAIAQKIIGDHGIFLIENLILNANEWDYVVKNVDKNPDKINLIKKIPNGENLLVIGANRNNGFFAVTHYEVVTLNSEKLKNLLKRGDALDRSGRAAVPSFATSP